MTTSRLAILFVVLVAGFSANYLLPKQHNFDQPQGVAMELPKMIGGTWYGRDLEVSDRERGGLGLGTEFARKSYTNARGDEIQASIVLSGRDMNTSIHRPEWCLPAQGWTIANSQSAKINVPDRGRLPTTRLSNMRLARDPATGDPVPGRDGNPLTIRNIDYYWFVGYTAVSGSHFQRNCMDITDRLLHGYNQRWAFVTVMAAVTEDFRPGGRSMEETDAMLQEFIQKLAPIIHHDTVALK